MGYLGGGRVRWLDSSSRRDQKNRGYRPQDRENRCALPAYCGRWGDPQTGRRQQVRRRYGTEKQARAALAEITEQASKGMCVPRKAVTVEELCADWLASLHNARGAGAELVA
jgi:Arm DNA-binding domain